MRGIRVGGTSESCNDIVLNNLIMSQYYNNNDTFLKSVDSVLYIQFV